MIGITLSIQKGNASGENLIHSMQKDILKKDNLVFMKAINMRWQCEC